MEANPPLRGFAAASLRVVEKGGLKAWQLARRSRWDRFGFVFLPAECPFRPKN